MSLGDQNLLGGLDRKASARLSLGLVRRCRQPCLGECGANLGVERSRDQVQRPVGTGCLLLLKLFAVEGGLLGLRLVLGTFRHAVLPDLFREGFPLGGEGDASGGSLGAVDLLVARAFAARRVTRGILGLGAGSLLGGHEMSSRLMGASSDFSDDVECILS